jgi:PAS domain S-box-containing protein
MPNPTETLTLSPTPSSLPDAATIADPVVTTEVRREQLTLLHEQLPVGVASTVVAAGVTAALFRGAADPAVAGSWLGLVVAVSLAHLVPWVRRRQRSDAAADPRGDLTLFTIGAALSGSLFGLAPVVFGAAAGFDSLAMMLIIVAMLGVTGVVALGADIRVYLAFLLPLTLPATVRMFYEPHPAAPWMGALQLAFVALLVAAALQLRAKLQQLLRLRAQGAARMRELSAHAERLQAETEQRRLREKDLNAYVATLEQTTQALTREVAERAKNEDLLARQALNILESEVRLRAIFNNAFDGILTFDTVGHIRAANPAAEHLFGIKVDEIKRRRIKDLLPNLRPEDAAPSMVCELSGRKADGSKFPASLSVERTESGTEHLFVCLVRDNTAEQLSRQALVEARDGAERANRAKSEFLSTMSHELRTPMNSILGFAQLLQTDPENPLSDTQKESVDQIARAGWHLLQLINDVLDLAKVEAGKIEAILEDVDLDLVMAECLSLVMPLAEKHGIELVDQATGSGLHVCADHTRLKQAVLNLVSNGIKYNRKNGSVAIEAKRVDDWCEIAVVDTGVGLSAEQIDRIFEPFSRVSAHRDEIEGTGIGLTITRKLVALMGGAIGVESQPGNGSRFWVRIPLFLGKPARAKVSGAPQATDAARTPAAGRRQTVLYVEDNPANLALVEYVLRQRRPHLRLLSAHTGELGISLAESQHPDLIILDISLPGMDGYQVLEVLRNTTATRDTPIFALSANAMQRDVEKGLAAGFDDYLTKPIDVARLLSTVDALLERRAAA